MKPSKLNLYVWAILFCTMASLTSAKAQDPIVGKMAQAMTDSLSFLKLTDQQKPQALTLNETAATSLVQLSQKAQQDTTLQGKVLFQQVMGIMKQRNTDLNKILSADQQKTFTEHHLEQLADLETKMMQTQLKLTDTQIPQVYQINLKATQEMAKHAEALKKDTRKLQKLKDAKALKSEGSDKDKQLKQVLTPDQYSTYQKNKEAQQEAMKEKMKEKKGK